MQDFEKLGAFYLGKRYDSTADTVTDELTLYDSKDLTTHGVIIGMTGSGKTGLGIGLIEEAALDHVPVIAIDPKGDLGNLLLSFPKLAPEDFEPWINPGVATEKGRTVPEQAAATAEFWAKGIADWGQSKARIKKLRDSVDMQIYTPGSNAATPISVLKTLSVPPELINDSDAFRERVQSTAQSILTLLDINADPLTSREHILLSNILNDCWQRGETMSLATLIAAVQDPPMRRIGVMEIDTFYPPADRFALAMRINNLLAAPGFEVWTQGAPLDIPSLLHSPSGKPCISVMSIAHLSDAERMFFVTALLSELVAWMRLQSGSSTLRCILYMDEVFGFLPPVANPPCKPLFLTLLKQARAYGVGLVLATQNPVDLDYKALSNMGTWMIGRLQTKRDIDRVRGGLEAASGAGNLEIESLDDTLAGMQKRCFLLHNVHESKPVLFHTRWVLSYLAGPLTTDQIRKLAPREKPTRSAIATQKKTEQAARNAASERPLLAPDINQVFLPPAAPGPDNQEITYVPYLAIAAQIRISRSRPPIDQNQDLLILIPTDDGATPHDWDAAITTTLTVDDLEEEPEGQAAFAPCPDALSSASAFKSLKTKAKRRLRAAYPLVIFKSSTFKAYSEPGETEGEFRARMQLLGNERRDLKVGVLRTRYDKKFATLEERLRKAEQAAEREAEQASGQKLETALSVGSAILGALLGRKKVSVTSANRVGTAIRKAGRSRQQSGDVARARETIAAIEKSLKNLEQEFDDQVAALDDAFDAQKEELQEQVINAKLSDIEVELIALGWVPHARTSAGVLENLI